MDPEAADHARACTINPSSPFLKNQEMAFSFPENC
jgi:hypothetical protein